MAKHFRWVAHENPETWHPQQKGNIEADGSTLRPLYHQDTELVMDILRRGCGGGGAGGVAHGVRGALERALGAYRVVR